MISQIHLLRSRVIVENYKSCCMCVQTSVRVGTDSTEEELDGMDWARLAEWGFGADGGTRTALNWVPNAAADSAVDHLEAKQREKQHEAREQHETIHDEQRVPKSCDGSTNEQSWTLPFILTQSPPITSFHTSVLAANMVWNRFENTYLSLKSALPTPFLLSLEGVTCMQIVLFTTQWKKTIAKMVFSTNIFT